MISLSLLNFNRTSQAKDLEGHVLTDLWQSYEKAYYADKPKEQMSILENIKKEALRQNLAWDYYDACFKYVDSATMRNWKDREKEQEARDKDIENFPQPVAAFHLRAENGRTDGKSLLEFVQSHKDGLLKGHNEEFYRRCGPFFGHPYTDILIDAFANDYEYALYRTGDKEASLEYFKGKYPLGAICEFAFEVEEAKGEERLKAAEEFAARYQGKAVALFAWQDILYNRFQELRNDKKAGTAEFRKLDDDCKAFIAAQKKFSGSEKAIAQACICPEQIHKELGSRRAGYEIKDGKLTITTRNLDKVRFSLLQDKKTVFEKTLDNPAFSFYAKDEVSTDLPPFDDGVYSVSLKAAGLENWEPDYYEKYSLSMAVRRDNSGTSIFVADYMSGEPVKTVDIKAKDIDGKTLAEYRGLSINGFTKLPASIESRLDGNRAYLQASYTDKDGIFRSTRQQMVYSYRRGNEPVDESRISCEILTDRSAFNPEETVHFKAILYKGHYRLSALAGKEFSVVLKDAERHELSRLELKTNEFGSAAGEFVLPRAKRNGAYSITVMADGLPIRTTYVTVDDFVLPTFALTWDKDTDDFKPGEEVRVGGMIISYSGHGLTGADISYTVRKNGETVSEGKLVPDPMGNFELAFTSGKDDNWAYYNITVKAADATGETLEFSRSVTVHKPFDETEGPEPKEYFFEELDDDAKSIGIRVVAGRKTTWAVVELFGPQDNLIEHSVVKFSPEGNDPASTIVKYAYSDKYPDVVTLKVLYFQNGNEYEDSHEVRRPDDSWKLPLKFTRFLDTTVPGATYTFIIQTEAGVECAATIFDKSTETVRSNTWRPVYPNLIPSSSVYYNSILGDDESQRPIYDSYISRSADSKYNFEEAIPFQLASTKSMAKGRILAAGAPMMEMAANDMEVSNAAVMADTYEEAVAEEVPEAGYIRENFANTIAWEPFLRSDKDGNISFRFTNADKLSTYYVQLFVHDPSMRNFALRKEMKVTLPVKVAAVEPQFLYEGDRYVLRASLSNSTDSDVSGTLTAVLLDGKDAAGSGELDCKSEKLTVPALGSANFEMEYTVGDIADLGIKLVFDADNQSYGSDAIFVSVPVHKAVQTITEAHSSILMAGDDRDALIARLRSEFVNASPDGATVREVSIRQMLEEAVPEYIEPKSDNVVSLTEALFARYLLDRLKTGSATVDRDSELLGKIMKCRKADGGFAWFEGMESSPILTVLVMQRFAMMGIGDLCPESATYLDDVYFRKQAKPYWCGWITLGQYAYVRSLYSEVAFKSAGIDGKRWKSFKKDIKNYLVPARERGLNGALLAKARRMKTLQALCGSEEGLKLAKAWTIRTGTAKKLEKSIAMDVASLVEYAVPYKNGGYYFPNAVMPWRGLIESEAYAHAMFCDLMDEMGHKDIADGVRFWLMLQKETQDWGDDPAFIEALNSVFHGSDELLATKVIALKASTTKPFEEIRASGNGFTVKCEYFRDGKLLESGDELHTGEKIQAKYTVTSDENRSFVMLSAPRCAALRPVTQTSGYLYGGYRNVLADRTEFWFESYPEEKTVRTEDFYVTQAGTFRSAVVEIECLYADHYRANDAGKPAVTVR